MSSLKIYDDSKNYTGVVVKLSNPFPLPGLDNLVGVNVLGNTCLIAKDYDLSHPYIFFPAGSVLNEEYLCQNSMYRDSLLNKDQKEKGYFEPTSRVKAIKFKGNVSTGIIVSLQSLANVIGINTDAIIALQVGDEFNEIDGKWIVKKYIVPSSGRQGTPNQLRRLLDEIIDSRMFPENIDTSHLLKNMDKLQLHDDVVLSIKMHGTSARVGYTLAKRKLTWKDKIAKWFGVQVVEEEYRYVVGSHHVIKSVDFSTLANKNHYFSEDLWSRVAKEIFADKLYKGEMIYFEIIGSDYNGKAIQAGYSYGFDHPIVFIYRISNINPQGIEVDLEWNQMVARVAQLGDDVTHVPVKYQGKLEDYIIGIDAMTDNWEQLLETQLKTRFMDKPALFDKNVIEEGIVLRVEAYPKPKVYKLKAPLFLLHESGQADKLVESIEDSN